jgi:hypothetical protein
VKRFARFGIAIAFLIHQSVAYADSTKSAAQQKSEQQGIAGLIAGHNAEMKHLDDERKNAKDKLTMELKTCGPNDQKCIDAQNADYARSLRELQVQELALDLDFMLELAKMGQTEAESIIDDIQKIQGLGGGDKPGSKPSAPADLPGSPPTSTLISNGASLIYVEPSGTRYTFPTQITKGGKVYHIVPRTLRSWTRPYVEYQSGENYCLMLGTPSSTDSRTR